MGTMLTEVFGIEVMVLEAATEMVGLISEDMGMEVKKMRTTVIEMDAAARPMATAQMVGTGAQTWGWR